MASSCRGMFPASVRSGLICRIRRAAGRTAPDQIATFFAAASGVVLPRADGVNLTWDIMLPGPRRGPGASRHLTPKRTHTTLRARHHSHSLTPPQQAATRGTQLTGVLHSSTLGFFPRRRRRRRPDTTTTTTPRICLCKTRSKWANSLAPMP